MENYAKYFDMVHLGEERGAHNAKLDFARNMLADGEPINKIKRYTGLSLEEINNIK